MDFKKNILTRIMAVICLLGWTIIYSVGSDTSSGIGGLDRVINIYLFIILPTLIIGSTQVVFSVIAWKKLAILDKIIFIIIVLGTLSFVGLVF